MSGIDTMIVTSILFLGGLGLLFGIGLGIAAIKFAVKTDPREEEVLGILAGANCGACGYPGCGGYASALVKGEAEPGKCTVIPADDNRRIASILGKTMEETERKVAVILCGGGEKCRDTMKYEGVRDCRAAVSVMGGGKACSYGCLGYGTCAAVCPFGAIRHAGEGKVPEIDLSKCTGCGVCAAACPRGVIELRPCRFAYSVACASQDKGAAVRKACSAGCIGCGLCVKVCPQKDIVLENNVARMKNENCTNCGLCLEKCPTGAIVRLRTAPPADLKTR